MNRRHGSDVRGSDKVSSSHQPTGRFGRMFRELSPASHPEPVLKALAETMLVDGPEEDNSIVDTDGQENFDIPAGYTYLGQFIDHDLTFDPASSLERTNDPDALIDFRTPRFDLDCVYGRGPDDQPYMYDSDGVRLLEGAHGDLLRSINGRAIIGDPRNDENRIVSQLQTVFIKFHNRAVTEVEKTGLKGKELFFAAQQETRWHYQWVVVRDFLKRIVGAPVVEDILTPCEYVTGGLTPHEEGACKNETFQLTQASLPCVKLKFYHWKNEPFIPVEFSGAVYRFGHSMVRPSYHLNEQELYKVDPLRERAAGEKGAFRIPIFAKTEPNLNGFRPLPSAYGDLPSFKIDWRFFFEGLGEIEVVIPGKGKRKFDPQVSYKIDTKVVEPLALLNVFGAVPTETDPARQHFHSLAFRNLRRGVALGLPSGQDVARKMGIPPLEGAALWREAEVNEHHEKLFDNKGIPQPETLGEYVKALLFIAYENEHKEDGTLLTEEERRQKAKADVDKLEGETPLWFYILREGERQQAKKTNPEDQPEKSFGARLGPVGGRIVAEVFLGLLAGDNQSYISLDPNWTPAKGRLGLSENLTMGEFVEFATRQ